MYQYNVKATRYPSSTYTLSFKATADAVVHTVQFVIARLPFSFIRALTYLPEAKRW
jgi:hypothetical protein